MITHREGWLDPVFVGASLAGSRWAIWIAIAAALALLRRSPYPLVLVVSSALAATLVTTVLKHLVERGRPPTVILDPKPLMEVPTTSSFPSGHSSSSFACAVALSQLAPRLTPWVIALAALIALSRVYVGVHYPLDVGAGAVLGVLVGLGVVRGLPRLREALRRSPRAPTQG